MPIKCLFQKVCYPRLCLMHEAILDNHNHKISIRQSIHMWNACRVMPSVITVKVCSISSPVSSSVSVSARSSVSVSHVLCKVWSQWHHPRASATHPIRLILRHAVLGGISTLWMMSSLRENQRQPAYRRWLKVFWHSMFWVMHHHCRNPPTQHTYTSIFFYHIYVSANFKLHSLSTILLFLP